MFKIQNYINGELLDPNSEDWLENVNPATGQVFSQVPNSDATDINDAVDAAENAFPKWSRLSNEARAGHLHRLADGIQKHFEEFVELESDDNGKPRTVARNIDIPRAITNLRFYAGLITGFASEAHPQTNAINYTTRKPLGAVGCITPWNLPLYLLTWKIAPALATGNCVIAKPPEVTPATAFRFSQICQEAGLPAGVLNLVHGSGSQTGDALTSSRVKAISFTGGTQTGKSIVAKIAPTLKKFTMELGGKNPNLVFADCQYERALTMTTRAAFSNQGQICLCGSRLYVQAEIYDRFRDDLVEQANRMVVGDPQNVQTSVGAMVSRQHFEKVLGCIETAKSEGGKVLCGGTSVQPEGRCSGGFFIRPTVIEGLPLNCTTNQQEIFGPVVTIQPFDSDREAIELANGTEYGLSASVWTQDIQRAHTLADQLEAGVVWVNTWLHRDLRTPFGGFKQSGVGREGGLESMRFWTQPKNICIAY